MISNARFLSKAFKKIDQIDKKHLVGLASDLAKERKLIGDILDTIQEGVIVVNPLTAQILFMNLSAKLMVNGDSNLNYPFGNLTKIVGDSTFTEFILQTLSGQREIYNRPYDILSPRYLSVYVSIQRLWRLEQKLNQNESDLSGVYCILLNPNTSKGEVAEQESYLERMSSILSLASGIAHEIGNPLNSINIHLHLLSKELDQLPATIKKRLKKSVQVVVEETERLDKIVRNFLKATRRHPIHFELGNIKDVLQDVLTLFQPQIRAQKIKLSTQFDQRSPRFFIDPERISLVFTNIIKNALQAMPKGGRLSIVVEHLKNLCKITITDTGIGISRESLPKVFDAYYTTKEEGSGLGLVIAYQIIREHGGRIEIKSEQKQGTSINILLPVRKEKLSLPAPDKGTTYNEQFI